MSVKKKKNLNIWQCCKKCGIIALEEKVSLHNYNCSPGTIIQDYAYILQEVLFCSMDVYVSSDQALMYIPKGHHTSLVLLTPSALSLCRIPIGDPIVVTCGSQQYIRIAWKGSEKKPALSAAFHEKDILKLKYKGRVTIHRLNQNIIIAKEITVKCFDPLTAEQALHQIKIQNINNILAKGNLIDTYMYCKRIEFEIISISSHDGEAAEYYKCTGSTLWRIHQNDVCSENENNVLELAGLQELEEELDQIMSSTLSCNTEIAGNLKTRGILLHGGSGTGKSTLMKVIANKWSSSVVDFRQMNVNETAVAALNQCLRVLEISSPSVLTIDDIDALIFKSHMEKNDAFSGTLAAMFDRFSQTNKSIVIIATTSRLHLIDKDFRRPGRFDREIEVGVPNPTQRHQMLDLFMKKVDSNISMEGLKTISDSAHGFVGADLLALVSKASLLATRNGRNDVTEGDFAQALTVVRPSALREITIQVPNVRWDDIGGQDDLKHKLRQSVEWPLKHADSFQTLGIKTARGVLMFGPPGCSKTMIAKALATESGLNFISVKGPEIYKKWLGESEKAIRQVFRRARQSSPSIIFFDELDALAGERYGASSGAAQVHERVLAQLLTEIDGVEALGHVIVVGATNRPDKIDPALLRPGRLDRVIYVPLPDADARRAIFSIQFRKTPVSVDVDVSELASLTGGYSGAEIVAVCHEAAMKALDEDISCSVVKKVHFLSALELVKPRTSQKSIGLYKKFERKK